MSNYIAQQSVFWKNSVSTGSIGSIFMMYLRTEMQNRKKKKLKQFKRC